MSLAALPMHQHISMFSFMPVLRLTFTNRVMSNVFTNVTIGIGDFIHISKAYARVDSWGIISVFIFLMLAEIGGCLAEMIFYISAKEGGIGETEQVADLLDAVVGLLQVIADVL